MQSIRPKVSVIVPCYDVEKYLNRCVDSLVNQTLQDIEIILVDDRSPDCVPQMCDEWAKKDSRIRVIHKEKNEGLGFARNTGLDLASGEYVAFVDSDDFLDLNSFEIYYSKTLGGNIDVVSAGIFKEEKEGVWRKYQDTINTVTLNKKESWNYAKDMVASLPKEKNERKSNMSVWHAIYKRSIIENNHIRFVSEREVNSEDIPFQLDFFIHVNNSILIPECLYHYCLNVASLTATFKEEKFGRYITMRNLLLNKLKDEADAYDRVNRFFIGYARSYTLLLMRSHRTDKLMILDQMLNNPIWNELKLQYRPSNLPVYQALLYFLQIHKLVILIFPYLRIATRFKKTR